MSPIHGPLKTVFERVELPFNSIPSRQELEARVQKEAGMQKRHAQFLLDRISQDRMLPKSYPYPVQIWQFGNDLTLIHLAGEVVVDYSLRLKKTYGWDKVWVTAYSNEVFAYIPSLRVLQEGWLRGGGSHNSLRAAGTFWSSCRGNYC